MKEFTIKASSDELAIACAVAEPQGPAKGVVQLVHGMCEHKERYFQFMEFLASNGYVAVISDLRGHGASVKCSEDLGFLYKGGWSAMVDDNILLTDWARQNHPDLKIHLFGHSMGSMVVRSMVKRNDAAYDTLFVCGCPSDNPAKGAGKALAGMFGVIRGWHYRPALLQKMSFGEYNKPFKDEGFISAWVCSDREILEQYHSDPLCQYVFTANGFYNLMGLMQDCYSKKGWQMKKPDLPIHFISGAEDPCRVSDKAIGKAVDAMRAVGYADVDLKLYEGMRHEILNETDKAQVWNDVIEILGQ